MPTPERTAPSAWYTTATARCCTAHGTLATYVVAACLRVYITDIYFYVCVFCVCCVVSVCRRTSLGVRFPPLFFRRDPPSVHASSLLFSSVYARVFHYLLLAACCLLQILVLFVLRPFFSFFVHLFLFYFVHARKGTTIRMMNNDRLRSVRFFFFYPDACMDDDAETHIHSCRLRIG